MKKITLVMFALIAGTTFAQNTKTATAPVNAVIVAPIGITLDTDTSMNFGTFTTSSLNATTATVILAADGTARDFSETDMEIAALTTYDVPEFTITKDTDATYKVIMSVTTAVTGGVTLSNLTSTLASVSGNSATGFGVGGTLTVPSTATTGTHTGQVSVTVTYE